MGMINAIMRKFVGSRNDRMLKKYETLVGEINALEDQIGTLDGAALAKKTEEYRNRIQAGETADDLLIEAFAVMREASKRVSGLRHFDVQLIGGMALHDGKISEMGTGEGKTLVATLPAYLNALAGLKVHIVTVNDYLAERDGAWMGPVYEFLGLKVGVVSSKKLPAERQKNYQADIIYCTNNELGFDYLRDNMVFQSSQKVQTGLDFAIVDEVDSILIDEARTPLIISGPARDHSDVYRALNALTPNFSEQIEQGSGKTAIIEKRGDYVLDEKHKQISFSEDGHETAERLLREANIIDSDTNLYDANNFYLLQYLNSVLRAHHLYQKDVDYIVENNEVIIVDEFTGRATPGRRWSEGLHQAVEAKEGVSIKKENQTLASTTFQNYFRLYKKLAGMTGTASTEAVEFLEIYGLEVLVLPPNVPSSRVDETDLIYLTAEEKYQAIIEDVKSCQERKQPVLIGTSSINSSERVSELLRKNKIPHQVLNAKQHQKEASVIANAGAPGAVTIATNMAGRGTDIVLGGLAEDDADEAALSVLKEHRKSVIDSGGLRIIGTERNESRRVDNQLRGRSGRQGDIGSARFYLSLEDNLMRIFASDKMATFMQKIGMEKGEAIEHKMVNRAIENAQRKVEGMNYDARKHLLEYDDVAGEQRRIIYRLRDQVIDADEISEMLSNLRRGVIENVVGVYIDKDRSEEDWDIDGLAKMLKSEYNIDINVNEFFENKQEIEFLVSQIVEALKTKHAEKESLVGAETMRNFEKAVMLQTLDADWKDHLASMDYLRNSINLRGYAQKNPVQEYKQESFLMFEDLLDGINKKVVRVLANIVVDQKTSEEIRKEQQREQEARRYYHNQRANALGDTEGVAQSAGKKQPFQRDGKKIGRNDPCHCGSGKKYKNCCG